MDNFINCHIMNYKSISSTALYFISTCREFFTCGEYFFQFHSNTTLYFIFIFIKIIFLLFYFNFFFLSLHFSFLLRFSSPHFSRPTTTPRSAHFSRSTTRPRLASPSPFPTVNHHVTTKSTENKGEIWRRE